MSEVIWLSIRERLKQQGGNALPTHLTLCDMGTVPKVLPGWDLRVHQEHGDACQHYSNAP